MNIKVKVAVFAVISNNENDKMCCDGYNDEDVYPDCDGIIDTDDLSRRIKKESLTINSDMFFYKVSDLVNNYNKPLKAQEYKL